MKENTIAKIFQVMAILTFIVGLVVGGKLGVDPYWEDFSFMYASVYWIGAFFSGMIFIAIAEVIELLELSNKTVK